MEFHLNFISFSFNTVMSDNVISCTQQNLNTAKIRFFCFTHSFVHMFRVWFPTTVTPQLAECFGCWGYCLIWDIWVCCKWTPPVSPEPSSYSSTPATPTQTSADHSTAGEFSARARFHISVWKHQHLLLQTWAGFIFLYCSGSAFLNSQCLFFVMYLDFLIIFLVIIFNISHEFHHWNKHHWF